MDIRRFLSFITLFVGFFTYNIFLNSATASEVSPKIPNANKQSLSKGAEANKSTKNVDPKVAQLLKDAENLKKEMIQLNQELYKFEEKLLYPTETQLSVFLSLNPKSSFTLDSIEIRLDDVLIATHLYNESEISALRKGGIQRIYIGSLEDGKHKLTAQFNGKGVNNSYYRRKKALKFNKENTAKFIQMEIGENANTKEPLFKVKQW